MLKTNWIGSSFAEEYLRDPFGQVAQETAVWLAVKADNDILGYISKCIARKGKCLFLSTLVRPWCPVLDPIN